MEAKAAEIRTAKYTEIQTLMTKDTAVMPDQSILWTNLARAELGLKKYDDAETNYKKALELETAAKKPKPEVIGVADAGLGEVYARQGKVPEANAAFDAAAKADPTRAAFHLRNEAVIFFQEKNADAQVTAADEALAVDPNQAILYYIKGQGLIQSRDRRSQDQPHRSASRLHRGLPAVPRAGSHRSLCRRSEGDSGSGRREDQLQLQGTQEVAILAAGCLLKGASGMRMRPSVLFSEPLDLLGRGPKFTQPLQTSTIHCMSSALPSYDEAAAMVAAYAGNWAVRGL